MSERTLIQGRIFAHYDMNDFFLEEDQLIRDAVHLKDIPGYIINGRFDMCTPPQAAYDMHQAWPKSKLSIVPMAGHRWNDELLARDIVNATNSFRNEEWS